MEFLCAPIIPYLYTILLMLTGLAVLMTEPLQMLILFFLEQSPSIGLPRNSVPWLVLLQKLSIVLLLLPLLTYIGLAPFLRSLVSLFPHLRSSIILEQRNFALTLCSTLGWNTLPLTFTLFGTWSSVVPSSCISILLGRSTCRCSHKTPFPYLVKITNGQDWSHH